MTQVSRWLKFNLVEWLAFCDDQRVALNSWRSEARRFSSGFDVPSRDLGQLEEIENDAATAKNYNRAPHATV